MIGLVMLMLFNVVGPRESDERKITFSEFISQIESGSVLEVSIRGSQVHGVSNTNGSFQTQVPNYPALFEILDRHQVRVRVEPTDQTNLFLAILNSWLPMILIIGIWLFFMRQVQGGEPGRGAVWKGGDNNLVFQKAIHRVRCTDCISPEFLLYCIEDDFFSNRLSLLYTGTTIKHLTGKALKKYPVRIPPIAEQMEIVRRVNSLLEASSKIEEQYLAAKLRVNQLTQSILKKAFEGELLTSEVENEFLQELSDVEAVEC